MPSAGPDSAAVDGAVVAKLLASAALVAIATDGVFWSVAPENMTRYVIVDLLDHADADVQGGRAYESGLYLAKYVERQDASLGYSNIRASQAAKAINDALAEQALTAAGYTWMSTAREGRLRLVETDPDDASVRWAHWGGHYRVEMSVVGM